jgi:hypothetical protein
MILTAIPREQLDEVLDRFMAKLEDPFSRAVFRRIRATSADRAVGAAAERHRRAALSLARSLGMAVHADGVECPFNWDGRALNGASEAYVILHEAAHFMLAPAERRRLIDFGLGPGPDTRDRDAAACAAVLSPLAREEDEAAASLLGIIWEAKLRQPALASFLDQNWLEGLERSAHSHFAAVLGKLQRRGCPTLPGPPYSIERRRIEPAKPALPEPQNRAARRIPSLNGGAHPRSWSCRTDLRDLPACGARLDRPKAHR